MEKFADLLKIIAEKHLIQTVASVTFAILGVAFFPNLFGMTEKVGKTLYGILIFCLSFLLIQFAKHICAIVKSKSAKIKKKRLSDELEKREAEENEVKVLESLWNYVDSLSPQDRYHLMEFLKTDNQPIEVMGMAVGIGLLTDSRVVACIEKQQYTPVSNRKLEFDGHIVWSPPYMTYHSPIKLYRLKDDFFKLLKYSYEKYGRISHFDMEDENNG